MPLNMIPFFYTIFGSFANIYNPVQNILRKIKKSNKFRQNKKTLTSVLALAPKMHFYWEAWAQHCALMQSWDVPNVFFFSKISNLMSFSNS